MGMAVVGDLTYMFGGHGASGYLDELHVFEPTTLTWTLLTASISVSGDAPSARSEMGIAEIGATMFVLGGSGSSGNLGDLHSFDTNSLTWSHVSVTGSIPAARSGMGMTAVGSHIYIFGGRLDVGDTDEFLVLDTTTGQWTDGPSAGGKPTARRLMGMGAVGESFYVFGGLGNGTALNDLFVFDTSALRWKELTSAVSGDMPPAVYAMGVASSRDELYLFGGSNGTELYSSTFVYDPVNTEWRLMTVKGPAARSSMGLVAVDSTLHMFGGMDGSGYLADQHSADFSTEKWTDLTSPSTTSAPGGRVRMGMADAGGLVFVFGGWDGSVHLSDLHVLDVATLSWQNTSTTGAPPTGRAAMGMASAGTSVYLFGGEDGAGYLDDVHELDPIAWVWRDLTASIAGSSPEKRGAMGLVAVEDKLYVFGGIASSGVKDDFHVLDVGGLEWISVAINGEGPGKRYGMGMAAVGTSVYVFAGYSATGAALDDLYTIDTQSMTWASLPESLSGSPSARFDLGMVALEDSIYVFGGTDASSTNLADLQALDVDAAEWTDLSNSVDGAPSARSGMGLAATGGLMIVFGGYDGSSYLSDLQVLRAPRTIAISTLSLASLSLAYDWDVVRLQPSGSFELTREVALCVGDFPCQLTVKGSGSASTVNLQPSAQILCEGGRLCTKLILDSVAVACQGASRDRQAFFISFGAAVVITNSSVSQCVSHSNKTGGIVHVSTGSTASISTSTFHAVSSAGMGGVVYADNSDLSITDSVFRECSSDSQGGAIWTSGALEVSGSTFTSCFSNVEGGCIFVSASGSASVQTSLFELARSASDGGGALSIRGPLSVSSSDFVACSSSGPGGAIRSRESTATISDSTFDNVSTSGAGGVLFSDDSEVTVASCDFIDSRSTLQGGAVLTSGALRILSSTFTQCHSDIEGGCVFSLLGGATSIEGTLFENAHSVDGGGAISARGPLAVSTSQFRNCSSAGPGGAIRSRESNDILNPAEASVEVTRSEWIGCSSTQGGAIYQEGGTLEIDFCEFMYNEAIETGGAVSMEGGVLTLSNTTMVGNLAEGLGGGAVHVNEVAATVEDVTGFSNEAAAGGGGMLFWQGDSPPTIRGTATVNIDRNSICAFACPCEACDRFAGCSCNVGYFGPDGGPCEPCPAGKYKDVGGSSGCVDCPAGKYKVAAGSEACTACPAGTVHDGNPTSSGCTTCAANTFSSEAASSCLCVAGYTGDDCDPCEAGTFKMGLGDQACEACPSGTYKLEPGAGNCSEARCPAGTVHSGAAFAANCSSCPENSYTEYDVNALVASGVCTSAQNVSGPSCSVSFTVAQAAWENLMLTIRVEQTDFQQSSETITSVLVGGSSISFDSLTTGGSDASCGTFVTIVNHHSIPAGLLTPGSNNAEITVQIATSSDVGSYPCAGFYLNAEVDIVANVSAGSCACNAGYAGPDGGTCSACPVGTYKGDSGSMNCTACAAGKFMETLGATACDPCPAGTFHVGSANENNCSSCPANSSSAVGSALQSDCQCNQGFTGPAAGPCIACGVGKFKDSAGSSPCTDCPSGEYKLTEGAGPCLQCPAGSYNAGSATAPNCTSCPADSFSPAGSAELSHCSCNAGFTGPDGAACSACSAGTYKPTTGSDECTQCEAGSYLDTAAGTVCIVCPDGNSSSAAGSDDLTHCRCNAGYTGPDGGVQCTACDIGTYKELPGSSQCADCSSGTYLGVTAGTACLSCPSGDSSSPPGSDEAADCYCNAGYVGSNGDACQACDAGKYKATASTTGDCVNCPAGTFTLNTGATACASCANGTYAPLNATTCTACPVFSSSPPGSTDLSDCVCLVGHTGPDGDACTACDPGTYKDVIGSSTCSQCEAGKYLNTSGGSECMACVENTVSPIGSTDFTDCACNEGYVGPDGGPCLACLAGTYKATAGSLECIACAAATYQDQTGQSACQACSADSDSPPGSDAEADCICNTGYTGPDGGACTACNAGEYKNSSGSAPCSNCPAGSYQTELASTACISCPTSTGSLSGSDELEDCTCNVGYTGPNGGSCAPCSAGSYKNVGGSMACTLCEAGWYLSSSGGTVCEECPATFATSAAGSSAVWDCVCNAGYTGPNGGLAADSCAACGAGTYKADTGCGNCLPCPAGEYQAQAGESACAVCPDHSDSLAGSNSSTGCICNMGYTGLDGVSCTACNPGEYKDSSGSAPCEDCPAGFYQDINGRSGCNSCPSDSFSSSASDEMADCVCNVGYTGPNGGSCTPCNAGTYKDTTGSAGCLQCETGKYLSMSGMTTCEECPALHSTSAAGSSAITDCQCNAGYFGPDGGLTCESCPAGTYKASTGCGGCLPCPAGRYEDTVGNSACAVCPDNSDSLVGSNSSSACVCNAGYTGPDGGPCTACSPGEYKSEAGSAGCEDCAGGSWLNISGGTGCIACPSSDSWSSTGASSAEQCQCNAGYTGPSGRDSCSACAEGTFKSDAGSHACTDCDPGKFKSNRGLGSCSSCDAGTFSLAGASVCAICPVGSDSAPGSGGDGCICIAGYTESAGSCVACLAGTYKTSPGSGACTDCLAGTWSSAVGADSDTCVTCAANSSSSAGSGARTDCICNAGYTGEDGYGCDACPTGFYKLATGSASCTPCEANTYNNMTAQTSSSSCQPCPSNSFSVSGSWSIEGCACRDGYHGAPGGPCYLCPADSFCVGGVQYSCADSSNSPHGSVSLSNCTCNDGFRATLGGGCVECPVDQWCSGGNVTTCPEHTGSVAGSSAQTDCTCLTGYSGPAGGPCVLTGNLSDCPLNAFLETSAQFPTPQCTCEAGYFGLHGQECKPCVADSYCPGGNVTENCTTDAQSPAYSANASACICNPGYYGGAGESCQVCEQGFWCAGGKRYSCGTNRISMQGSSSAADCICADGYAPGDDSACFQCERHFWCASGVKTACGQNSSAARGSSAAADCKCNAGYTGLDGGGCTACAAGKHKDGRGSGSCVDCPADTYSTELASASALKCAACPANSSTAFETGRSSIQHCQCNLGYDGANGGPCTASQCPPGTTGPDAGSCLQCAAGKYKAVNGSSQCMECETNTYFANTGASACTACPSNSQSPTGSTSSASCLCNVGFTGPDGVLCVACSPGEYKAVTGSLGCESCPAGTYLEESAATACEACPANSSSSVGSDSRTDCHCGLGYTGPDGGTCTACSPGSYKIVTGSATCTQCETGKYLSMSGMTTCEECPALHSTSAAGSSAITDCQCNAGYFGPDGGLTCESCPVGTYKASTGCGGCLPCPAGRYEDTVGNSACAVCPDNSDSLVGSNSSSACVCNAGYTGPDGGPCTACSPGEYKSEAGSAGCEDCAGGSWLNISGGTACLSCPSDSDSAMRSEQQADCECNAGYAGPQGGVCVACLPGSFKAGAGSASCTLCAAGKYLNARGGTTCEACPAAHSHSPQGSAAVSACVCNVGYTGPDGGLTCSACPAGTYKGITGCSGCIPCAEAEYQDETASTACKGCPVNSVSPTGSNSTLDCVCNMGYTGPSGQNCTACSTGQYKGAIGSAACDDCLAGTYRDQPAGSACEQCPSNSQSVVGSDQLADCVCTKGFTGANGGTCKACSAGTFKTVDGSANCTSCEAGKYLSATGGTVCVACPAAHSSSPEGSSAVTDCACIPGYTGADGGAECLPCSAGSYKASSGSAECTKCASSQFQDHVAATACIMCPANSVSPLGSNSTADCECNAGYTGLNGHNCTACGPGAYKEASGSSDCDRCAAGTYRDEYAGTACQSCASNSYSTAGSADAKDCVCNAGYEQADGASCSACEPGTYKNAAGSANCTQCEAGKYFDLDGGTACYECPSIGSSSLRGSPDATACVCNAGYSGFNGGNCSACDKGFYKMVNGSTACRMCASGKYLDTKGGTVCTSCPSINSYSPAGSVTADACICNAGYEGALCTACAVGTFKLEDGDGSCQNCSAGSFKSTAGPGNCSACSEGTYAVAGASACTACPIGSTAPAGSIGSTACSCNAGYAANGDSCTACAAGKYKESGGSSGCLDCPAGSYKVTAGPGTCTYCNGGTFHEGSAAASVCSTCPSHSTAAVGSSSVSDCECDPGYTGPNGQECVACAAGTYKDLAGADTCTSCPPHSTSAQGSASRADCACNAGFTGSPLGGGTCIACNETANGCNIANYGSCIASSFKQLRTLEAPDIVHPGETFRIVLARLDHYNQTITSASSSVIQVFTSLNGSETTDDTVSLSGTSLSDFQEGIADFTISVIPSFSAWSAEHGTTTLVSHPFIRFAGNNIEEGGTMLSDAMKVELHLDSEVCTQGSVLDLTHNAGSTFSGVCTQCPAGKYSLNPLVGEDVEPSCLNCPAGAAQLGCDGGSEVQFDLGTWTSSSGKYFLQSCPIGHRMENSTHDSQECQDCGIGAFIFKSDDPAFQCQRCPGNFECPDGGEPLQVVETGEVVLVGLKIPTNSTMAEFEAWLESLLLEALGADGGAMIQFSLPCDTVPSCQALFDTRRRSEGLLLSFDVLASDSDAVALLQAIDSPAFTAGLVSAFAAANQSVDVEVTAVSTGGVAEFEIINGVIVITACPAGYLLINSSLELQHCRQCEPTTYSFSHLDGCAVDDTNVFVCPERECQTCPDGAECTGGDVFVSLVDGAEWQLEMIDNTGVMRLAKCPPGYILVRDDNPDRDQCVGCPKSTYSIMEAVYPDILVQPDAVNATDICEPCPQGGDCKGLNIIDPEFGWWILPEERDKVNEVRAGAASQYIEPYRCGRNSCLEDNQCASGRDNSSLVCGLCAPGYAESGSTCTYCGSLTGESAQDTVLGFAIVLFTILWWYASWRPFFARDPDAPDVERPYRPEQSCLRPLQDRLDRAILYWADSSLGELFKIIISFCQIMSTFEGTYSVQWTQQLITLWDWASLLRLDWRRIQVLGCVSSTLTYLQLLRVITLIPIFVSLLLATPSLLMIAMGHTGTPRFKRVLDSFWYSFMFFWFLSYPLLSGIAVQSFSCADYGNQTVLISDVSVPCPYKNMQDEIFHWAIAAVILFPFGVPILIYCVLRWKRVPEIAERKLNQAILAQMLSKFLQFEAGSILPKLAASMALTHTKDKERRFKEMYDAARGREETLTVQALEAYLRRLGIRWAHDQEFRTLIELFDEGQGRLSSQQFSDMMHYVIKRASNISGVETVEDIEDYKLETLVRVPWGEFIVEDDAEDDGFTRELKAMVNRRIASREGSRDPSPERSPAISRQLSPRSTEMPTKQAGGLRKDDEDDEDEDVCRLPYDAPREEKLAWLLNMGRKLLHSGGISIPVVSWNGDTEQEKLVLDRVGLLFNNYKIQYWYFELVEMGRKFFMTSIIIFMYTGSPHQTSSGLLVTSTFLMLFLAFSPYRSRILNRSQAFSLAAQAATLFYGLMTTVEEEFQDAGETESQIMGIIILILNIMVFLLPVGAFAADPGNRKVITSKFTWVAKVVPPVETMAPVLSKLQRIMPGVWSSQNSKVFDSRSSLENSPWVAHGLERVGRASPRFDPIEEEAEDGRADIPVAPAAKLRTILDPPSLAHTAVPKGAESAPPPAAVDLPVKTPPKSALLAMMDETDLSLPEAADELDEQELPQSAPPTSPDLGAMRSMSSRAGSSGGPVEAWGESQTPISTPRRLESRPESK